MNSIACESKLNQLIAASKLEKKVMQWKRATSPVRSGGEHATPFLKTP
jgi:hypothetical protein